MLHDKPQKLYRWCINPYGRWQILSEFRSENGIDSRGVRFFNWENHPKMKIPGFYLKLSGDDYVVKKQYFIGEILPWAAAIGSAIVVLALTTKLLLARFL